ncbi:hypothetical protein [Crocosphaera sp. Alani8]|uniref:hypothetical protein n=1 Tax=Crocosphaera sp. Alani8 TaxID=3038952 RepID=UPI00313F3873
MNNIHPDDLAIIFEKAVAFINEERPKYEDALKMSIRNYLKIKDIEPELWDQFLPENY